VRSRRIDSHRLPGRTGQRLGILGDDEVDQILVQREIAGTRGVTAVWTGDEPVEGDGDVVDELAHDASSRSGTGHVLYIFQLARTYAMSPRYDRRHAATASEPR
jgi:hypothetical protein